jgi:hypothetical protein
MLLFIKFKGNLTLKKVSILNQKIDRYSKKIIYPNKRSQELKLLIPSLLVLQSNEGYYE